ncbi:MAG: alpha-L-fucosidase [Bacteroidota bacterium]
MIVKKIAQLAFVSCLCWSMGCSSNSKEASIKDSDRDHAESSETEKFAANWESLQKYETPEWFSDAKLGIFIHWGPYAVPAKWSEWYPRFMYQDSVQWHQTHPERTKQGGHPVFTHHTEKWGHPSKFGYKDFIPMFKAEKFDATEWVNLFKEAGAKYVVPVAEHHDGFAMYKSNVTRWNAAEMGPKRDVLKELSDASKAAGLKVGASSHFAFNWDYFNKEDRFDTGDPQYADLYGPKHERYAPVSEEFMELWWARTKDIIDNYQPDVLWFDFYYDRPEFSPYHPKMAAYYYNKGLEWNKKVVLQSKNMGQGSFPEGTFTLDIERGKMSKTHKETWQTDTSIGKNSWCYTEDWESKTADGLVDDLIDIVSKNGTMLLNIGPKADGTIPESQQQVLLDMGKWLKTNGVAIYGSRPWRVFGEGPTEVAVGHHSEKNNKALTGEDFRFTTNNGKLYAIAMDWSDNGKMLVKTLAKNSEHCKWAIEKVKMVGSEANLNWKQTDAGLEIELPAQKTGDYAYVFEVDFGAKGKVATQNLL